MTKLFVQGWTVSLLDRLASGGRLGQKLAGGSHGSSPPFHPLLRNPRSYSFLFVPCRQRVKHSSRERFANTQAHVHDREKSNDDSSKRSLMGRLRRLLTSAAFEAKHVTRMFEEANTIELKGSAWDMTLFMFYHPLGIWTNISVFACVAFNTSLQLAFTYIVNGFIAPSNDDLDELLVGFNQWRNMTSPHLQELVCESSFALGSEYRQQETYFKFYDYTSDGELNSPGFILCCAVCAVWSLTVLKPVGELLDQMKATWHLCSSQCTIMEIAVVPGGFALERIPIARHIFFVLMGCIQLLIAVGLLIAGLRWLGSTNDIVELLLNGVALSYIMEIDELTYSVLVPTKVATLIQRLQPISVGWSMRLPVRTVRWCVVFLLSRRETSFTYVTHEQTWYDGRHSDEPHCCRVHSQDRKQHCDSGMGIFWGHDLWQ